MPDLIDHIKKKIKNKEFTADVQGCSFEQHKLIRVHAVKKAFTDVSFKQSVLNNCYFRNCTFIRCDFTGAHIKETNLRGTKFSDCKFAYATWEHSQLEQNFLKSCLPAEYNLARDMIRSLRVNFSQIGNCEAVNKAASMEVQLTGKHLYNAAYSKQSYYRTKYTGFERVMYGLRHVQWKFLELLWGNGESIYRVAQSSVVVILLAALLLFVRTNATLSLWDALRISVLEFWGLETSLQLDNSLALLLAISRLILFGLFMAILVKRLSRR